MPVGDGMEQRVTEGERRTVYPVWLACITRENTGVEHIQTSDCKSLGTRINTSAATLILPLCLVNPLVPCSGVQEH
jgi:hypothetical protein